MNGGLMTGEGRWVFPRDDDPEGDPLVALRARAALIHEAGDARLPIADALELLFDEEAEPSLRRAVLRRKDLSDEVLVEATRILDPEVRAYVMGMARIPAELVGAGALDEAWQVRVEVARHPSCPDDIRVRLAADPDAFVRRTVLACPTVPESVLIGVLTSGGSRQDAEIAGWHAALRPRASTKALMCANDHGALALLSRTDLPRRLVARFASLDHGESVRRAAVQSNCPVKVIGTAATSDPAATVRVAAVSSPNCPPAALATASRDADPQVRRQCAENASCPGPSVDVLLADRDEYVRVRAAKNVSASPLALARAVRSDNKLDVRRAAVGNPACPAEVIIGACADPELVLAAAAHPACQPEGLFQALLTMRDMPRTPPEGSAAGSPEARRCMQVRSVVKQARRRLAPCTWEWLSALSLQELARQDLQRLITLHLSKAAADPRVPVRIAVVHHPDVDGDTLAVLAADADEDVRRAVSARILSAASGGRPT